MTFVLPRTECPLHARQTAPGTSCLLTPFKPYINAWCFHFTDEDTEAQRNYKSCSSSQNS